MSLHFTLYLAILPNTQNNVNRLPIRRKDHMDNQEKALFEARARVIKAMAHPARLFMVDRLAQGEQTVGELQGLVGSDISTVSKHLAVLRNAGIIQDDKRGNQVFYSLRCPCVLDFFSCVESVLQTNATVTLDLMEERP